MLLGLGAVLLAPYAAAWRLGNLRERTVEFEILYFLAFGIYAAACVIALRMNRLPRCGLAGVFALAVLMMGLLLFTRPALSDDMYRYVWEGRVQAAGISPYRYAPDAAELQELRDDRIWPLINRKNYVTIYPPGAQLAFALLWRIRPDDVRTYQAAMALGALVGGGLLIGLLRDLGRPAARAVIYLWSPLLIFETAHSAHLDGLLLPVLIGAWWARVRERPLLTGALLGLATAMKLYPALLLPALWQPRSRRDGWRLPLAFALALCACYLPYVVRSGPAVLGYLPHYFGERFNLGLAGLLIPVLSRLGADPNAGLLALTVLVLVALAATMIWRPATGGEAAIRRCIWLIGAFTLATANLYSWYLLWVLPLAALCLLPGRLLGLRADAWTGWWLFCGLVGLSYTFFIRWRPAPWALWVQYLPLYLLLMADALRRAGAWLRPARA